ncbi:hypothetical protein [Aquimarina aquimarini]|uniref:hypothetical protein n=1 Tax=Aquimarina aquimarini TaxID=1191734 RepID=UPI000D55576D|nr:hypothetical protein [Aquimarina aquimarini]
MEDLFLDLKNRYGQAKIDLIGSETIEVYFSKAKESVIIQRSITSNHFMVSYPKLTLVHTKKKDEYVTHHNIVLEGLLWILKKVNQEGKVVPEN